MKQSRNTTDLEETEGSRLDLTTTTKAFGNDDCITCADVIWQPTPHRNIVVIQRISGSNEACPVDHGNADFQSRTCIPTRAQTYDLRHTSHNADLLAVTVHEEDNDPGESSWKFGGSAKM